jgi:hypothetical protein
MSPAQVAAFNNQLRLLTGTHERIFDTQNESTVGCHGRRQQKEENALDRPHHRRITFFGVSCLADRKRVISRLLTSSHS